MKLNFRNKYLVIAVRVILGLMFLGSGVSGLYSGTHNMSGVPDAMIPMSQALWAMGIFQMIKVTEVIAGLMLVLGFLPALAAIFVAPICVGVIVFNARVAPDLVISGVIISILDAYLGYAYWDKYKGLFAK